VHDRTIRVPYGASFHPNPPWSDAIPPCGAPGLRGYVGEGVGRAHARAREDGLRR
jgi:hypothetical protein